MKIVYLHQYYNTPEMPGSTRSYEMARRWVAQGHDVHIITTSRSAEKTSSWVLDTSRGAKVHWRGIPYENAMGFRARMLAFIKFALVAGPRARSLNGDVVFATSTPLTVILPALYATIFRKAPIVLEVRDLWPSMPIATGDLRNPVLKMLAFGLERLAYRASRRIVALSPDMVKGITALGIAAEKVVLAPNSCDLDQFDVDRSVGAKYRAQLDWLGDRPFVVYCGTLGKLNDVGYLVRLAAGMKDINAGVVFGIYGSGKDEAKIRALALGTGTLGVNLYLMGEVAKKEVPVVLSAATVVTSIFLPLPEMRANSANKFFDGLAAAKPIAINYGGWQAEVLTTTGAGIVMDESDIYLAACQLAELIGDRLEFCSARDAARRIARQKYSRDAISGVVLGAVTEAVHGDARHPSR